MVIDRQISTIDINTPAWVNEKLFENLLTKEVEDFRKIWKFSTKQVKNIKENNLSVNIGIESKDGKKRAMGFILKTSSSNKEEKLLPYLNAGNLNKENFVNFEIIPSLENLYQNENNTTVKLAPSVFKFPQSIEEEYILYEDLQLKGFKRPQHDANGLNLKQMTTVLEKLAAFHAASVANKKFNKLPTSTKVAANELQILTNRIFHENLRSYNLREYEDKIKSLQAYFLNQRYFSNPQDFNVLLLGNCCSDNMLFQYDAFGNIKDLVFINFDTCSYGSPTKDLLYLLLSSVNVTDKLEKFEFYVKYYYDHLLEYLKVLNFKGSVPKLTDVHYDLIKNNQWALEAVTQVLPLVLWDTNDISNFGNTEDNQSTDKLLKVMYAQHNYGQQIEKLLPWLENKAFLEE